MRKRHSRIEAHHTPELYALHRPLPHSAVSLVELHLKPARQAMQFVPDVVTTEYWFEVQTAFATVAHRAAQQIRSARRRIPCEADALKRKQERTDGFIAGRHAHPSTVWHSTHSRHLVADKPIVELNRFNRMGRLSAISLTTTRRTMQLATRDAMGTNASCWNFVTGH